MQKIKDYSLYLVITEEYGNGRGALEIARAAIAGGVDIIQMREKNRSGSELVDLGKKLSDLCVDNGVIFIVNDDPRMARDTGAAGLHLGQEDVEKYPVEDARRIMGRGKIIGISTHSMEDFKKACLEDVDYIAYGPVFRTRVKENYAGTEDIDKIMAMAKKPVFFIGGINLENIGSLLKKGARNVSLIRAITEADDIASATRSLKKILACYKNT